MNRFGHLGFSLILFSPLLSYFSTTEVMTAILFSMLPDIDLVLRIKHRMYTHNILFASLISLAFLFLLKDEMIATFIFLGVFSHILADLLTKMPFAPLYPLYRKRFALRLFRSDNAVVNYSFLIVGIFFFAYFYGIKIY